MSEPLLQLDALSVGYPGRTILQNVDLTLDSGRWVALLGPNASGKSTLLKCLGGHLAPLAGQFRIAGHKRDEHSGAAGTLPAFCVSPDELPPFLTVQQCMEIQASAHGLTEVPAASAELAQALGLREHASVLVRHASLGTKQKLAIVLALMRQPRLLLLDEVFNGLDAISAVRLRHHLRAEVDGRGMSILMATHSLDLVCRCCDELLLLDDGRLAGRWLTADFTGADPLADIEAAMVAHQAARTER